MISVAINAERRKILSDAKGGVQRGMGVVEFATAAPILLTGRSPKTSGRISIADPSVSRGENPE